MTKFETVVFDLDGTLIHSAPDLHAAANVALVGLGCAPLDLSTVTSFIGNGVEKLVERCLNATGKSTDRLQHRALAQFLDYYENNMTTLTRPYSGVVSCLDTFKAAGLKMAICTNKPTGPARDICDQLGLSQYFDVVVGAVPGALKKPDATPLLTCIAAMKARPEKTLYVGDSAIDFQTARNANVPFRLFTRGYLHTEIPELAASDRFDDWTANSVLG